MGGGGGGGDRYNFNYVASIFERSSVFTNSGNVNGQISDFFEGGAASEFVAKVLAARRSSDILEFRNDYPSQPERPMSVEEWEAMMNEWLESQEN